MTFLLLDILSARLDDFAQQLQRAEQENEA